VGEARAGQALPLQYRLVVKRYIYMGLEDSKDLSTCGDERVIRSVDRVYDRYVTMEGSQGSDTLSETWSELLGIYPLENLVDGEGVERVEGVTASAVPIGLSEPSSFVEDPWSELLHAQGVGMVDLQRSGLATVHVSLSEVEVEQVLQINYAGADS